MPKPAHRLVIKRTARIGFAAAEEDKRILQDCFVDNQSEIDVVNDKNDPRCILIGRTGSGKTALILQSLSVNERTILLLPENLSIEFVENSDIISFLVNTISANFDLFFKLLWRHVIAVEIIKHRFGISPEDDDSVLSERIKSVLRSKADKKAIVYLREMGASFWKDSDVRVKEIVTKVEDNVSAGLEIGREKFAKYALDGGSSLSEVRKTEILHRSQSIIQELQARRLTEIIALVDNVLDDDQKVYRIFIDKLDENWVDGPIRYKLIRSLIETAREFNQHVANLKIIVSIRLDLLKRVYTSTRDAGFQEEKYDSLYIPVEWARLKLIEVLDKRVDHTFKSAYTKDTLLHSHVLKHQVDDMDAVDYMLERTLMRPRDLILFFNECIYHSDGLDHIPPRAIKLAEVSYSKGRLESLYHEWRSDLPMLEQFVALLCDFGISFIMRYIKNKPTYDFCVRVLTQNELPDPLPPYSICKRANDFVNKTISFEQFRKFLLITFWEIGLVGIKLDTEARTRWKSSYHSSVSQFDFTDNTNVFVHPAFYMALGLDSP